MKSPQLLSTNQWQDLVKYKPWEMIREVSLPIPWFLLEMWALSNQHYLIALLATAYFFLTCLRLSHNAFHYCVGLPRKATDFVMIVLSVFMMTSMRATQFTHMQHHRFCLEEQDVEGYIAKLGFWTMLIHAPMFTINLHKNALKITQKSHPQHYFWIKTEILLNIIWMLMVWFWFDSDALQLHTILMLSAHAVSPFFTVWSVHHDCDTSAYHSRTLRSAWLSPLAYNMFFHLEHHSYPAIPTCHLPELAKRLDAAGLKNYKTIF